MTARQALDLKAELAQPFLRQADLPVFKGILVAAADEERELAMINREEASEVEAAALRFVIGREASGSRQVEQAIMAVHGVVKLADLSVSNPVALRPHHACQQLEHREGASDPWLESARELAQDRRCVPGVRVATWEKPAIKDENAAYVRPARRFTPLRALKPPLEMLQDDKRGKVEGNQRRGLDAKMPPDRFDEIGALSGGIPVVLGFVAIAHTDILDEEFRHAGRVR